jgi:hypothetical protein
MIRVNCLKNGERSWSVVVVAGDVDGLEEALDHAVRIDRVLAARYDDDVREAPAA